MTLLEKLAPYLPYDTPIRYKYKYGNEREVKLKGIHLNNLDLMTYCKPILRPLSDLDRRNFADQVTDSLYCYYGDILRDFEDDLLDCTMLTYNQFQVLLKNHFDVFGMIESGEAIDINTLQ